MLQMAHKWSLCVNFNSDYHGMSERMNEWVRRKKKKYERMTMSETREWEHGYRTQQKSRDG